jgi:zinc-binding alcohol dehydrogenase family protein
MAKIPATMQAIVQEVYGGPEVLRIDTVPTPTPSPRDLLVRVRATAINPVDAKVRSGGPAGSPVTHSPQIVGWDAAGIVAAVGDQVQRFAVGEEVFFAGDVTRPGSYAQFVAVDERLVGHKPTSLSFEEAAAVPLTALTAWEGLIETLGAQQPSNEFRRSILIVGGAGGVGSIAMQIAKRVCNLHVIATASRPESHDTCLRLGADAVIDHTNDFAVQLHNLGHSGVDYIFTTAPLTNFQQLVASLNPLGKICAILGGEVTKQLDVSGLYPIRGSLAFELMLTRPRLGWQMEKQGQILDQVCDLLDTGVLVSTMNRVLPWTEAQAAHGQIETGHTIGKIVMTVV